MREDTSEYIRKIDEQVTLALQNEDDLNRKKEFMDIKGEMDEHIAKYLEKIEKLNDELHSNIRSCARKIENRTARNVFAGV